MKIKWWQLITALWIALVLVVIALKIVSAAATLVPGTNGTWTDGVHVWAGNQFCAEAGKLLSPDSPAVDAGTLTELHCKTSGPHPGEDCIEWYGFAPDIGACEYVPPPPMLSRPNPPTALRIEL